MSARTSARRPRRRGLAAGFDRLEARALLATFTVSNADDGGPGSLRDAIERANAVPGADVIAFAIPGEGPHVIAPSTPLPRIAEAVVIDGYTQPGSRPNAAASGFDADLRVILDGSGVANASGLAIGGSGSVIRGLWIRRFDGSGIAMAGAFSFFPGRSGSDDHRIEGNILGAAGEPGEGNGVGVSVVSGDRNTIGGPDPAARNLISGNREDGVRIAAISAGRFAVLSSFNAVLGNLIGADRGGSGPLGNGRAGVAFTSTFSDGTSAGSGNAVGSAEPGGGNVIAFNGGAGVRGVGVVSSNAIFENAGLGIDLFAIGPEVIRTEFPSNLNYPLLTSAEAGPDGTRVRGVLLGSPDRAFRLEFFADAGDPSGFGEGRFLLGAADVVPDASGNAAFDVTLPAIPPDGTVVTATATLPEGGTSEFSPSPAALATFADLVVSAGVDATEVRSGDEVTFSATFRNNGPGPAPDATLTVSLPRYSLFFSGEVAPVIASSSSRGTVAIEGDGLIVSAGTLEPGAVVAVSFTVRAPTPAADGSFPFGPARLSSSFRAESGAFDPFVNNDAELSVVVDRGSLLVEGRATPEVAAVGGLVTVEYTVTSGGPAPAGSVMFRLPIGLPFSDQVVSVSPSRGTIEPDGAVNLGTLRPGEAATVTVVIRPNQPGPLFLTPWILSPNISFPEFGPMPIVTVPGAPVGSGAIELGLPDLPRGAPRRVAIAIGLDLDPARAVDRDNYRVEILRPDGRAHAVALRSARYDPDTWTVTLETRRPLPIGRTIRVTARSGGLTHPDGTPIDGDGDFLPGGDFVGLISTGHALRYRDTDGDRVSLALSDGLIELHRRANGDARAIRLLTTARRATLFGRVQRAGEGDGATPLPIPVVEGRAEEVRDRLPSSFLRPSGS